MITEFVVFVAAAVNELLKVGDPGIGNVWKQFCFLRSQHLVERGRDEEASRAAQRLLHPDRWAAALRA